MRRQYVQMIWFGIAFVLIALVATFGAVSLLGGGITIATSG